MLRRVGHSSCIRCLDFETSDGMSFEEQDAALRAHLNEKHPGWQTDGGASILERRLPKADKDRIAELEEKLADAQERLEKISRWCEAYPVDVFVPPDWKKVQALLGDALLTQVSAACMRRALDGVAKITRG